MAHRPSAGVELFERETEIAAPVEQLFGWHERPGAFERLVPPFDPVTLLHREGDLQSGRVELRVRAPFRRKWVARHHGYIRQRQFIDTMERGPFRHWEHTHLFEPLRGGRSLLRDRVEYEAPFGALGRAVGGVEHRIAQLFGYRHHVTRHDVEAHRRFPGRLRIAITGAGGLIGSALTPLLTAGGHAVSRMVRRTPRAGEIEWSPTRHYVGPLDGHDAVVHLAGENVGALLRWSPAKRREIRESRIAGTRLLAEHLAAMVVPPRTLICASAIGWYGDRGDELLDEDFPPGDDFFAGVVRDWEAACEPALAAGIRVVNLRFGIVLSPQGGALPRMLPPFGAPLASGSIGGGQQWWSWVALDDAIGAIHHALCDQRLRGPHNVVAGAVRQRDFAATVGRVLRRPAVIPLPRFVVSGAMGEMGRSLLLASTRVSSERLAARDYRWRLPELEDALRHLLGRREFDA